MLVQRSLALGPEEIKLLWVAFDATWSVTKEQYACSPEAAEVGRLRLANALLSVYRTGVTDPEALKEHALGSMQGWSRRDELMPS